MSPHKTNKNMETSFKQTTSNKVERYRLFLPQFELLISDEKEEISVLANTAAALRELRLFLGRFSIWLKTTNLF